MVKKISNELRIKFKKEAGPFNTSIFPQNSPKLETRLEKLFSKISKQLDFYNLEREKNYFPNLKHKCIDATLTPDQILELAEKPYVNYIMINRKKGTLPNPNN